MGGMKPGKIDPKRLAFDFDGVVADTMTLFLTLVEKEYGIKGYSLKDITSYDLTECLDIHPDIIAETAMRLMDGDYDYPLKPMAGAPEALRRIAANHGPVLIVTARSHAGPLNDWVGAEIGLSPEDFEIISTGTFDAKPPLLKQRGVLAFVEDRLETCFLLDKAGIAPVVFVHPWNRDPHPFLEARTWDEILALAGLQKK